MNTEITSFSSLPSAFKSFKKRFQLALKESLLEDIAPWDTLYSELDTLITILDDPDISKPLDRFTSISNSKSIIDRLGLGKHILGLIESGISYEETAEILRENSGKSIKVEDVENWLNEFDKSSISSKSKVVTNSIWNTKDIYDDLYIQMSDLIQMIRQKDDESFLRSRVTKEQVLIESIRELRQLAKDAESIMSRIEESKKVETFIGFILRDLKGRISPAEFMGIVKSWSDYKSTLSMGPSI